MDITLSRYGQVDSRTGTATITGTYTCTNADFVEVFGEVRQRVGRFTVVGSFGFSGRGHVRRNTSRLVRRGLPTERQLAGGKSMTVALDAGPQATGPGVPQFPEGSLGPG